MGYKLAYIWNGTSFDNFGVQAVQSLNNYQPITTYSPTAPTSPVTGQLWVNSITKDLFIYDGSLWKQAGGSSGKSSSMFLGGI